MDLGNSRRVLGVLGELSSHVVQLIGLKDERITRSLAMRYLTVKISLTLRSFCEVEFGSPAECVKKIAENLGEDRSSLIDNLLRVGEELIHGGDEVTDKFLERLLKQVPELYVRLERVLQGEYRESN
ncbi:MAG: hypothetical protein J7L55_03510 [Desulfurococcales archaeon]|nr:hypothetical protein [Desulfurococcales archaeon]